MRITLPRLRDYLTRQDYSWEVIVVDDGSSDGTARIPNEIFGESGPVKALKNSRNRGKGYSVKRGALAASGELILITDADFSTPVEEVEKLHAYIKEGYDIAVGSRSLAHSNVETPQAWYREGMGRVFNVLVRMMVLRGYFDTQCGFKYFIREKAIPIFSQMTVDGFCFDVEFLFVAKKRGLKVKEAPVTWRNGSFSRVGLIGDSIRMFLDLIRIRKNDYNGFYH